MTAKEGIKMLKQEGGVLVKVLKQLQPLNNVVLGGSKALELHGIELGRKVQDIDLVIYSPTDEQIKTINTLHSVVGIHTERDSQYAQRSFKVCVDDTVIDILPIKDEKINDGLLTSTVGDMQVKVQSIKNVMRARQKYTEMGSSKYSKCNLEIIKNNFCN